MKALETVYWLRVILGVTAAFISTIYGYATNTITADPNKIVFTTFLNTLSLTIIVYIISYYIIKNRFLLKVEKPQKLFTTGIGVYFIAWIVFWALLYTIIATMQA
jgi:hypothetical protein